MQVLVSVATPSKQRDKAQLCTHSTGHKKKWWAPAQHSAE
jgi:hypothetical protein